MAKVKVPVVGTVGKAIFVDSEATKGAVIGVNLLMPDGSIATLDKLAALNSSSTGVTHHRLLQGLTLGDDHPQYTQWSQDESITGQWQWSKSLWGPNGTAALPGFTFTSDIDTGLYRVAANDLGFATNGVLRLDISTTAFTGTLPWQGQDGSASVPALSFSGDTNTGIYRVGTDEIGLSTGGTLRWDLSTSLVYQTVPLELRTTAWTDILFTDGSPATLPPGRIAYDGLGSMHFSTNAVYASGVSTWARDDISKPSFAIEMSLGDNYLQFFTQAAGSGTFSWDSTTAAMQISPAGHVVIGAGATPDSTAPLYIYQSSTSEQCVLTKNGNASGASAYATTDNGGTRGVAFGVMNTASTLSSTFGVSGEAFVRSSANALGLVLSAAASAGYIRFLTGSAGERLRISTTAFTGTLPWQGQDGTVSAPAVSFSGDTDTGLYRIGANNIGIAVGGVKVGSIASGLTQITNASTSPGTGLFLEAPNLTGTGFVSIGVGKASTYGNSGYMIWRNNSGTPYLSVESFDFVNPVLIGGSQVWINDGTVSAPGLAFLNDTNTGMYRIGADNLGFSVGGTLRLSFSTTAFTGTLPWQGQDGTAAAPAFSFSGDTDNGLYYIGTNNWGLSGAGVKQAEVGATFFSLSTQVRFGNIISPTQLAANTNDWSPTGLATASIIRVSTDASRNLTGIVAQAAGTVLILCNVGTQDLVLMNDVTSTAANRFLLGADRTLSANESITIWYDGTSSRWRAAGAMLGDVT